MNVHRCCRLIGRRITDQQSLHVVLELKSAVQTFITDGLWDIVVNFLHFFHGHSNQLRREKSTKSVRLLSRLELTPVLTGGWFLYSMVAASSSIPINSAQLEGKAVVNWVCSCCWQLKYSSCLPASTMYIRVNRSLSMYIFEKLACTAWPPGVWALSRSVTNHGSLVPIFWREITKTRWRLMDAHDKQVKWKI